MLLLLLLLLLLNYKYVKNDENMIVIDICCDVI